MKSWIALGTVILMVILTWSLRRQYRNDMTHWMARHAGRSYASGRRCGLVWLGGGALVALAVLAIGFWANAQSGPAFALRYVAGVALMLAYAPVATLGAPKMTRWQKSYGQHLVEAGATREAAAGLAAVAKVSSAVGLLVALGALFLVVPANL